jgi:hypothetical protein
VNESTKLPWEDDSDDETVPGDLPFDQELDFNSAYVDDEYSLDIWDEDIDDDDLESDEDY